MAPSKALLFLGFLFAATQASAARIITESTHQTRDGKTAAMEDGHGGYEHYKVYEHGGYHHSKDPGRRLLEDSKAVAIEHGHNDFTHDKGYGHGGYTHEEDYGKSDYDHYPPPSPKVHGRRLLEGRRAAATEQDQEH
ncbi:hypothetical protein Droror1_Dr00014265 [Drosera rotundifolia]